MVQMQRQGRSGYGSLASDLATSLCEESLQNHREGKSGAKLFCANNLKYLFLKKQGPGKYCQYNTLTIDKTAEFEIEIREFSKESGIMEMNLDVSMCEWNEPLMRYCVMNFGSNLNKIAPAIINDRKFEWVKWSFPLLKIIKSGNDDMLNMNRRRYNEDLKGVL